MRATAITLVLLAHLAGPFDSLGVIGVELFFVLSGFLIGGILIDLAETSPPLAGAAVRTFWVRRWMRTLPAYYLFLVFFLWWDPASPELSIGDRFWHYGFFVQNLAWPCPWFFAVSWSLAVEEWFYVLLPVAIFVAQRCLPKRTALWSIILIFIAASFVARGVVGAPAIGIKTCARWSSFGSTA